jgi:hypothetical protein
VAHSRTLACLAHPAIKRLEGAELEQRALMLQAAVHSRRFLADKEAFAPRVVRLICVVRAKRAACPD